jgi:hypothetical protein
VYVQIIHSLIQIVRGFVGSFTIRIARVLCLVYASFLWVFIWLIESTLHLVADAVHQELENNSEHNEECIRVAYLLPAEAINQPNFIINHWRFTRGLTVTARAVCNFRVAA